MSNEGLLEFLKDRERVKEDRKTTYNILGQHGRRRPFDLIESAFPLFGGDGRLVVAGDFVDFFVPSHTRTRKHAQANDSR